MGPDGPDEGPDIVISPSSFLDHPSCGIRPSALVALMSAIGPVLALWLYGPYPEGVVMPLALGGFGGLLGFVAGIMAVRHPLHEEVIAIWTKLAR